VLIDSRYFFSISLCGWRRLGFAEVAFVAGAEIGSGDEEASDDILLLGRFFNRLLAVGSSTLSSGSSSLIDLSSGYVMLRMLPVLLSGSSMDAVLVVSTAPAPSFALANSSSH
jgi:hypothetical protein